MRSFLPLLALALPACTGIDFGDTCAFFLPSCTAGEGDVVPDEDTCYEVCDPEDMICSSGTCTEAQIDPCAGDVCQACGGSAWLCM